MVRLLGTPTVWVHQQIKLKPEIAFMSYDVGYEIPIADHERIIREYLKWTK